eukprot:TRINITY_DN31994_c0_g1_i1.p1 TRINITY_DN31994_c0_g1~~TRINITY_DN31994_c0_g1_i1.p1  ORF type:complete len:369 (-),score=57.10 TRINITY_DN31994_c0_g1_i1:168-1181(-)
MYASSQENETKCDTDQFSCCSDKGWCGNSQAECLCEKCQYYQWDKIKHDLPMNMILGQGKPRTYKGYKNFAILPQVGCSRARSVIIVFTAAHYFRDRQLIRQSWGSQKQLKIVNAVLVFVIGEFNDEKVQTEILKESKRHGDILQGQFEENYHKLAYKSMSALLWSQQYCKNVPWIVKTDDDTINNIWKLDSVLKEMELKNETNLIACHHKTDNVIRPGGIEKWAVTKEEYPDDVYPTNCFGTFYVMSSSVRDRIYQAFLTRKEKIFKIDDVFVTGILAKEANVTHKQLAHLITDVGDTEIMLTGAYSFGHMPTTSIAYKVRYWLWRKIGEHMEALG